MSRILTGFAALAMTASAATAADMVVDVPFQGPVVAVPAGHDWSGWYAGGYAGGLWGTFTGGLTEPGLSGVDAGVQIHYNAVLSNNWVLSPFLSATIPVQQSVADIAGPTTIRVNWAIQGGLRLGYAHGRFLPYAYAGGVIGEAHADQPGDGQQNTHTGYTLGAGLEYAVDDRWTVGARYAYYSLGAKEYSGLSDGVGWNGHSVLATISFKLH